MTEKRNPEPTPAEVAYYLDAPRLPAVTRPCLQCAQRLELVETSPHGLQCWRCPNGHLLFSQGPNGQAIPQADGDGR